MIGFEIHLEIDLSGALCLCQRPLLGKMHVSFLVVRSLNSSLIFRKALERTVSISTKGRSRTPDRRVPAASSTAQGAKSVSTSKSFARWFVRSMAQILRFLFRGAGMVRDLVYFPPALLFQMQMLLGYLCRGSIEVLDPPISSNAKLRDAGT